MATKTGISWCDSSANAIIGCSKVLDTNGKLTDSGCKFCYAAIDTPARVLRHRGIETWGNSGQRVPVKGFEKSMLAMNRKPWICDECGTATTAGDDSAEGQHKCVFGSAVHASYHRRRVFCDSNSDWLDEKWPIETLAHFLDVLRRCPDMTLILCTKRPENFFERVSAAYKEIERQKDDQIANIKSGRQWNDEIKLPDNCIVLVSVENQEAADKRIPELLKIPAACRGLSLEPLLSAVDLSQWIGYNVANENTIQRTVRLSSGGSGRIGNQSGGRDNLARGGSSREQVERWNKTDSLRPAPGRDGQRGIPSGAGDDKQEASVCSSAQAGLSSLQGSDSRREDDQSRRREQAEQQSKKSDSRHKLGTNPARDLHIENPSGCESERGEESKCEADSRTGCENQDGAKDGRAIEENCSTIRDSVSDRQQDSQKQQQISWLICGGESGTGARPCSVAWIRSLVAQGKAAGVATFVKQFSGKKSGEQGELPDEIWNVKQFPSLCD